MSAISVFKCNLTRNSRVRKWIFLESHNWIKWEKKRTAVWFYPEIDEIDDVDAKQYHWASFSTRNSALNTSLRKPIRMQDFIQLCDSTKNSEILFFPWSNPFSIARTRHQPHSPGLSPIQNGGQTRRGTISHRSIIWTQAKNTARYKKVVKVQFFSLLVYHFMALAFPVNMPFLDLYSTTLFTSFQKDFCQKTVRLGALSWDREKWQKIVRLTAKPWELAGLTQAKITARYKKVVKYSVFRY